MNNEPIFVEAITARYECPECSHPNEQTFKFTYVGEEIKFKCKQCNFENSCTMTEVKDEV